MGAGSSSTGNNTIKNSRKYYSKDDIALCTCTPPTDICTWGTLCAIPLRNTARMKMQLLEKASAPGATDDDRNNLKELHQEPYCCHGFTFSALQQMAVAGAMDGLDNDAGSAASALYQASFIMRMRSQLTGDRSGSLNTCLESCLCGACVNCNNAYVVHRAVDRFQNAQVAPAVSEQPVAEQQHHLLLF